MFVLDISLVASSGRAPVVGTMATHLYVNSGARQIVEPYFFDAHMSSFVTLLIGFLSGCSLAATGVGGGVLLIPLLVLVLHVPPVDAVGAALIFMSVTKILATFLHWKQGTVDFRLAGYLSIGSIPGVLIGTTILRLLQWRLGEGVNHLLRVAIGTSLLLVASFSLITDSVKRRYAASLTLESDAQNRHSMNAIWIGLIGGLLVSVTSVGSGSLIILLMLIFCPRVPATLVGTDIFHGLVLATAAALGHLSIGHTDMRLIGWLLIGSIGGVPLGTRLAVGLAPVWLRRTLLVLAATGGAAML